ncbi:MAG: DEAD/DEAH box helicase family protein, partial [Clostridia bacterium]|nr:DEAD/DEAH box helicase family protein [Clostridia bacterium]
MKVITYLEEAIEDIGYESLGEWRVPDICKYSLTKTMFDYQQEAIKNAIKVLNTYYTNNQDKKILFDLCVAAGMPTHTFDVPELDGAKEKYNRLIEKFTSSTYQGQNVISGQNFFNRMCFWMATASGKTLLIIKMIEILDYLKRKGLIPNNDFMVLLPSEKIQSQFVAAVDEYNLGKERTIKLTSLKKYEDEVNSFNAEIFNEITVYVYRSDLLSNQEKTRKVDTVTYDNGGKWYIFMDEAHKGDKEDSLRQDYITIMSRNGFLFNFSATFTDPLDFATTCYNFNLDKFIRAKYGKNIYLSESKYQFKKKSDDFSDKDKQLQVLKSLITLTLVKQSKKPDYYHNPLMVTLVNEVNTQDSDTDLFFAELAKIAKGSIDVNLFEQAKSELYDEFVANQKFQFGDEALKLENDQIKTPLFNITVSDVLRVSFNANSFGQIQVVEGEKGKEFALKLATAEKPFALFRIGDASQYIREKLNGDYLIVQAYDERHYFDELNSKDSPFTMLIGSRMFYEGWDSNRPNVM